MRLPRNIVLGFVLLLTINPILCSASEAANVPDIIYAEVAKSYEHIFIGTAINKTIEADRTFYIFNISEYLKQPLNSTTLTLTVYSGSEVVSPAGSYHVGEEYLVFFNEFEGDRIVGLDYLTKFLGSLDDSEIQNIREVVKITNVSNIAQDNLAFQKELADYSETQKILFNIALLLSAIIIFMLYIRLIRK